MPLKGQLTPFHICSHTFPEYPLGDTRNHKTGFSAFKHFITTTLEYSKTNSEWKVIKRLNNYMNERPH